MFNEFEIDSTELAKRMVKARKNKGWSQEKLAEMLNCSAQNVAKFEKNGLTNIKWIGQISQALGQNLLIEVVDVDGPVSEIGKQILITLIHHSGTIDVWELIELSWGLEEEQVSKEIYKLAMYGLVMREPYVDWYDQERDRLFITAKGVITLKNMPLNTLLAEELESYIYDTTTYEQIVGKYDSYQDYIIDREAEKQIRSVYYEIASDKDFYISDERRDGCDTAYFINFVKYLKATYETEIDKDFSLEYMRDWCPGISCYHDVLYRMAYSLSNKKINDTYLYPIACVSVEMQGKLQELFGWDNAKAKAVKAFEKEFDTEVSYDLDNMKNVISHFKSKWNVWENKLTDKEADLFELMESKIFNDDERSEIESLLELLDTIEFALDAVALPKINKKEGKSDIPIDWFSKDEIIAFIDDMYKPAETEKEKEIEVKLKKIIHLIPESLSYFTFPKEWEDAGIADYIRQKIGFLYLHE